jgi:hypothetical protein
MLSDALQALPNLAKAKKSALKTADQKVSG